MSKITLADYLAKKKLSSPDTKELDEIAPFKYNVLKPIKSADELIDECMIELEKNANPMTILRMLKDYKAAKLINEKTQEMVSLANAYFLGYR